MGWVHTARQTAAVVAWSSKGSAAAWTAAGPQKMRSISGRCMGVLCLSTRLVEGLREQREQVGAGDGGGQAAERAAEAGRRVHQHQALHQIRRRRRRAQPQAAAERLRHQRDLAGGMVDVVCQKGHQLVLLDDGCNAVELANSSTFH